MKRLIFIIVIILSVFTTQAQKPANWSNSTAASVKARIGAISQSEADLRYPLISDGDPTPIYSEIEVNELLKQARKYELLRTLQLQGSTVVALPAAASNLWYGAQIMTDSRPYQTTFIIPDTITVSGVGYNLITQGNFNADNYNGFFLCSVSGSNYTVIASTANDATLWKKVASTYSTKAFTSPVVLVPGVYKLYGVYNTSDASPVAAPSVYVTQGGGSSTQYAQMMTNGHKFEGYISGTIVAVPTVPFSSSTVTALGIQVSFVLINQ